MLMLLGTQWSLSPRPTDKATTFVVPSEAQTLSADALEHTGMSAFSLDDILPYF
jgi:hypothetical protein